MLPHILESVTQKKILEAQKLLKIKAVARGAEGGKRNNRFSTYSHCVSVLLHFLLHVM